MAAFEIAIETGKTRVFAHALAWPGLGRSAKTEADALASLLAYAPRYAAVLRAGKVRGFTAPKTARGLTVAERLDGNASTDFGAIGRTPEFDRRTVHGAELTKLIAILDACWAAFDAAADAAVGVALRTGPRGGGRDLEKIRAHIVEAETAYIGRLGGKHVPSGDIDVAIAESHDVFLEALEARARGEVADVGPRGGARWTPRHAVRVAAWHALDHTWEIEDRAEG
jgi:hypothetical protein